MVVAAALLAGLSATTCPVHVEANRPPARDGLKSLIIRDHSSHADDWYPKPEHVVRLHRMESKGESSMLETEARWERREHVAASPFVPVSTKQFESLTNHHHDLHRRTQAASSSMLQTSDGGTQAAWKSDVAITRLAKTSSQYIGPMDIGTMRKGPGCDEKSVTGELPYVVPANEGESLLEANVSSCYTTAAASLGAIYDTGSTNLWIRWINCKDGPCMHRGTPGFDPSNSMTFEKLNGSLITINFGTGTISGYQIKEDMHLGPFPCYGQTMGLILHEQGDVFYQEPFDIIAGLGFPSLSSNGAVPFFDTVIQEKHLTHNMFSFYFSRDDPAKNGILWGGVDPRFFHSPLTFVKVHQAHYWSVKLVGFKIGNTDMLERGRPAFAMSEYIENQSSIVYKLIVDSGTTFFTAGADLISVVFQELDTRPCDKITDESHPDIVFTLETTNGKTFDMIFTNMEYMVQHPGPEAECAPSWMNIDVPEEFGPAIIFGEVGMRKYFTTFDRQDGSDDSAMLGVALAKQGEEVSGALGDLTRNQVSMHSLVKHHYSAVATTTADQVPVHSVEKAATTTADQVAVHSVEKHHSSTTVTATADQVSVHSVEKHHVSAAVTATAAAA